MEAFLFSMKDARLSNIHPKFHFILVISEFLAELAM